VPQRVDVAGHRLVQDLFLAAVGEIRERPSLAIEAPVDVVERRSFRRSTKRLLTVDANS